MLSVRMDVTDINMTLLEYEKKLTDPHCCLMVTYVRQHLTLPPKYLSKMADGIREQLHAKLKLYSEKYVVLYFLIYELVLINGRPKLVMSYHV